MLLFVIIVCFVVEYKNVVVGAGYICDDNYENELYLFKNYLIRVKWDTNKAKMVIDQCKPDRIKTPKQFDPGHMFQNVTTLILWDVDWSILKTDKSKLTHVEMLNMISLGDWNDCSQLDYLFVVKPKKDNTVLSLSPDWLINCTRMQRLKLRGMNMAEMQHILRSASFVRYLTLESIEDLPRIVQIPFFSLMRDTNRYLIGLSVNVNVMQNTTTLSPLTDADVGEGHNIPANLTWADVSAALVWQVSTLSLESLSVSGSWFDMCATGNSSSVKIESLKYLWLGNTNTARLCFKKHVILPQLTGIGYYDINLKFSPGFKLQVGQLFSVQSPQLVLDLNNRGQVSSFQFTRDDYLALSDHSNKESKKSNLTLVGFRQLIKCDCTGASWWFARAIRAGLVTAPGVLCEDSQAPEDLECEWIDCDRISCNSCVCCQEDHNEISVDCREANLKILSPEMLHLPNLTRLVAPKNNITSLPNHLPDNLLWVDLSGNNIWHAGASHVGKLFTQPARRTRLSGNYILCSCENKELIDTLQNKSQQIEDYSGITCAVTGTKLGNVDVSQLCASRDHDKALIKNRETMLISLMSTLVLAVVSLVLALVLYLRRREIQIFLFARGWCLYCITEEDLDADRFYDVFVSFCHEDTEFVLTELLPSLDRDYSVCIHLRDWCPGEMIPSHINKSVQQSRRTLVVMSRNFVRSSWGRLEFQTAHVSGLADGRVRVVMIILDDVLEKDQLAPELRSYVRLNTYMRWDDPWFWEKLRYALPHHRSPRLQLGRQQLDYGPRETHGGHIEMMAIEEPEISQ